MDLQKISFAVSVSLGRTKLLQKQIDELQVGDILLLDQKHTSPLTLQIGCQKRLSGRPGLYGQKRALRIGDAHE